MKNLRTASSIILFLWVFIQPTIAQTEMKTAGTCIGYPTDQMCCQKNRGTLVTEESGNFCYLNLLASRVTKAECMDAGGYAYWRNDSTMLCLPKGTMVMTGNVSTVDESAKTISFVADGQTYTVNAMHMMLPSAGETIDLYYTIDPEGKVTGKTCHPVSRTFQ